MKIGPLILLVSLAIVALCLWTYDNEHMFRLVVTMLLSLLVAGRIMDNLIGFSREDEL